MGEAVSMLNISADTLVCKHRLPGTKTPSKRSLEPRNQGGVPDDAAEEVGAQVCQEESPMLAYREVAETGYRIGRAL